MKAIVEESYRDVMKNPGLRAFVLEREPPSDGGIDLRRLSGVGPDHMRIAPWETPEDAVDPVLRVAEVNESIVMASRQSSADPSTSDGAEVVLASRCATLPRLRPQWTGFGRVVDLSNLPDPGTLISTGKLTFQDLWKVRESRQGKAASEGGEGLLRVLDEAGQSVLTYPP